MNGPEDDAPDEPLPPVDPGPRSTGFGRLPDVVLNPARHAEHYIVVAYLVAVVGLALPVVTGFDGPVTVLAVSVGLLFVSFVLLFVSALVVTSASADRDDRR